MAFEVSNELEDVVQIKVVGVGGGGGNALNCMVVAGIKDVDYIAVNTDSKALHSSQASPVSFQVSFASRLIAFSI